MIELRLRALVPITYNGIAYLPGDIFLAQSDKDALILCGNGKTEKTNKNIYQTASVKAEEPAKPEPSVAQTTENAEALLKPRRRYMRRDMKAQE